MRDDLYDFCNELIIWRDSMIPCLYELAEYRCNYGVELDVHIIRTRQGWQELVQGVIAGFSAGPLDARVTRDSRTTQDLFDELDCLFVRLRMLQLLLSIV